MLALQQQVFEPDPWGYLELMIEDAPSYRIRLFLSVDLVGSTAFKSKSGRSNLEWIKAFQKFYGEFPTHFKKNYEYFAEETPDLGKEEKADLPKVWKTIGDEILFVNRITSVTQLSVYIRAFSKTLIDFGREVQSSHELNTKGNAWIAAFPTPNRSIRLSLNGSDPLIGKNDVLTEELEADVDVTPSNYDFLGKGIDGGFRISRNSTTDNFTVSPALALLLCRAKRNVETTKFDGDFVFHEPQAFKGVVNGEKYPVISIITSRDTKFNDIKKMESDLLNRLRDADVNTLYKYLESYLSYHNIESPNVKLTIASANIEPPENYKDYIKQWKDDLAAINISKSLEEDSASPDETDPEHTQKSDTEVASNISDVINDFMRFADAYLEDKSHGDETSNDT